MTNSRHRAIAIVGVGAVLPDAPDAPTFWENVKQGRYSISEVPRERWDPDLFWDPDPKAPAKTYSKIGGWVKEWAWEPLKWNLPIPPKVGEAMDRTQKWALLGARQALADYGYPERPLDRERVAVILGNAMGGDLHYETATRISYPEIARELERAPSFAELPEEVRARVRDEFSTQVDGLYPRITEDTMPGELANIIAGRVANLFDFHGPNYVVDAACASAMAAI
ncbi:MAG: beta-ketoacyl synthase N-terminal-like domain-containing protein, partial [Thermoanaerobaculia bacterium]